ncbi:MAG: hypothetical protein JWO33_330 [Caulobacteraceae bacterium]|nr:hypothetical protein [Caulobacteraceae bacterium]
MLLHRLLFFSDAVFAIILTLLALELRPPVVPADQIFDALVEMGPHFGAFALSFAVTGVFWLGHLTTLRSLAHFDWLVAATNLAVLLILALMPFVCGLVGEYGQVGAPWQLYCAVLIAASLGQTALLVVQARGGGRLMDHARPGELPYRLARTLSPGIAFGLGLVLSLAGADTLSSLCWVPIPAIMLAARALRPKPAAPAGAEVTPRGI